MPDKRPEFWQLDLTKLTWCGWLLILVAIGTVIGVAVLLIAATAPLFGDRTNPGKNPVPRWMGVVAVGLGIAAGSAVFELGRRLLGRIGLPITRGDRQ